MKNRLNIFRSLARTLRQAQGERPLMVSLSNHMSGFGISLFLFLMAINSCIVASELRLIRELHRIDPTGKNEAKYIKIKAYISTIIKESDNHESIDWVYPMDRFIEDESPCCCISAEKRKKLDNFRVEFSTNITKLQLSAQCDYAEHRRKFEEALQIDDPQELRVHIPHLIFDAKTSAVRFLAANCFEYLLTVDDSITNNILEEFVGVQITDNNSEKVSKIATILDRKFNLKSLFCNRRNAATLAFEKQNFSLIKELLKINKKLAFETDRTGETLIELCQSSNKQLLLDSGINEDEITKHISDLTAERVRIRTLMAQIRSPHRHYGDYEYSRPGSIYPLPWTMPGMVYDYGYSGGDFGSGDCGGDSGGHGGGDCGGGDCGGGGGCGGGD